MSEVKQPVVQQSSLESQSQERVNLLDKFQNKYKTDESKVNLNQNINIQDVALTKYKQMKKDYNFVSFQQVDKKSKVLSGEYEKYNMPIFDFNENLYQYRRQGYCANPNAQIKGFLFSQKNKKLKEKAEEEGLQINEKEEDFLQELYEKGTRAFKKEKTKKYKSQRQKSSNMLDYLGPWAGYGETLENGELTELQKKMLEQAQEKRKIRIQQARKAEEDFEPYSIFHWSEYADYKGQSYLEPPVDFKPINGKCYIPQKSTFTWNGSQREGYQVLRFFPKSGHFLLSGNAEGKVLLFDVIKNKSLAHTYVGHSKAVRDIQFTNDGKHFLSCAFDGIVHYWDTQYGKILRTFKLKKLPFSVKFHPSSERQNSFLCGSSNKKILQFDLNTGTKEMEYKSHLGTVNTITFIDNVKFVSSSDDKKLFVWQFGIPVVTKHVSEPEMHTITATTMHPSGQYFAGQSSDNQIVIYENKGGNFRRIRAKNFSRHQSAGYACGIDFSHDGDFLISGDERGKIFFYNWKDCKLLRTFDAHSSVCINAEWHPSHPTTVATCGWDGEIKLWQGK